MLSQPEPDILESEVKWAWGSTAVNKASGFYEIPVELFKSLKDDAIKVLHWLCQQIWKSQQWPQDWKGSIPIPIPKKGSTKECANHWTIVLTFHVSKVMFKILHARLQHYANQELPMYKLGLEKEEELDIKLPAFTGSYRKLRNFRKTSTSVSSTTSKPLILWIIINCGKLLKRWEYQTILTVSSETCMWVKKWPLRTLYGTNDWFKIEKEVRQGCLLSPCLFNPYTEHIMRNAGLGELQAGETLTTSDKQMIPL